MKTKELRGLSVDELRRKEQETRQALLHTRIQKTNQQLKNPLKLRELRRTIARVLTIIKEKGLRQAQSKEDK